MVDQKGLSPAADGDLKASISRFLYTGRHLNCATLSNLHEAPEGELYFLLFEVQVLLLKINVNIFLITKK